MRLALPLCLLAAPAAAWDFTSDPVCTIWHATEAAEMVVSYDPLATPPYRITVTLAEGAWPRTSPYAIRFEGPNGFAITTDRHRFSEDGSAVIAEDTGFGNVLRGLEGNFIAAPVLGAVALPVPLAGAEAAVAQFRDCATLGLS